MVHHRIHKNLPPDPVDPVDAPTQLQEWITREGCK